MSCIAIVGGGASGLMAAIAAAQNGVRTVVYERNRAPGRKLLLTGKGRCNVTNIAQGDAFLQNIKRNPRFLYSALAGWDTQDTIRFFERIGVPLKVERGGRVFPSSDRSADIVQGLYRHAKTLGVIFELETRVARVAQQGNIVSGLYLKDGGFVPYDGVILCTGGLSYPATGSTGDGYAMAQALGHTIVPVAPSLVPVILQQKEIAKALEGLSLKNVQLTVYDGKRQRFDEMGEMVFTGDGVSGPLVLSASSVMSELPISYTLKINLKPALTREKLDARLLREFEQNSNKQFKSVLPALLPRKLAPVAMRLVGIAPELPIHQISRSQRLRLLDFLQDWRLKAAALGPMDQAIVTRGGVRVGEVSPKTMESKLVDGLYFAGEILDVDALTGGYNIQIALSTGWAAGNACARSDWDI